MKKGRVHIYSGDGHGKSPAAYGQAIMSAAVGESVMIIQFLKGRGLRSSEFISRLEPEIRLFRFEKSTRTRSWQTPSRYPAYRLRA